MIAILDTSAFLRLFIPDGPVPIGLEEVMRGVERGENTAIAPAHMLAEACNVANRKRLEGMLSGEETLELVRLMCRMPVRYVAHLDLVELALELAEAHALTVYDALFLALARQKSARLCTADARLAKQAGCDDSPSGKAKG